MTTVYLRRMVILFWLACLCLAIADGGKQSIADDTASCGKNIHLLPERTWKPDPARYEAFQKINRLKEVALVYEDLDQYEKAAERWNDFRKAISQEMPHLTWAIREADLQITRMNRAKEFSAEERKSVAQIRDLRQEAWRLIRAGQHEKATESFNRAGALADDVWGKGGIGTFPTLVDACYGNIATGNWAIARQVALRLLQIKTNVLGEAHPSRLETLTLLRECTFYLRDPIALEEFLKQEYPLACEYRKSIGQDSVGIERLWEDYAVARNLQNDRSSARAAIDCGIALVLQQDDDKERNHHRVRYATLLLGRACLELEDGQYDASLDFVSKAKRVNEQAGSSGRSLDQEIAIQGVCIRCDVFATLGEGLLAAEEMERVCANVHASTLLGQGNQCTLMLRCAAGASRFCRRKLL